MKLNNLLFTLILLFFSHRGFLNAQIPLSVNQEDFATVAEQLVCQYPQMVGLEEIQIVKFLENTVAQSNPGGTYYAPPIPEKLESLGEMISFQWEAVPLASGYHVGSLGLENGESNQQEVTENSILIEGLSPQLYLFAFQTNGPDVDYKELIIIIDDKDLGFVDNTSVIPCLCTTESNSIRPKKQPACLVFKPSVTSFPWNNDCPINKYAYQVTGNFNGQLFKRNYYFLYEENTQGQDVVYNFPECNPEIPALVLSGNTQVVDALNVVLNQNGVEFNLLGSKVQSFHVDARKCGCYYEFPTGSKGEGIIQDGANNFQSTAKTAFQVSPNPFTDEFTTRIDLPYAQKIILQLFDLNGKLVKEERRNLEAGKHQLHLSSDGLGKGLYQIRLQTSKQIYLEKVLRL